MAYAYILLCSDNTLYTGATKELEKRVEKHNNKKGAKYTRGRTPVKLVYYEKLSNYNQALKRENQIKNLSRKEKEKLIYNFSKKNNTSI